MPENDNRVYPEGSVSWDEAWRQRQRADSLEKEVERLNQMLRNTGYGQGQIDDYAAQCEEVERIKGELEDLYSRNASLEGQLDVEKRCLDKAIRERDEAREDLQSSQIQSAAYGKGMETSNFVIKGIREEIASLNQRIANEEHRVYWRDVTIDGLNKRLQDAVSAAKQMYDDNVESQNCDYSYLRDLAKDYPWLEER